jgi:uncharacterized protein (DUF2252 family)
MRAEAEQLVRDGLADYAQTLTPDRRLVLDRYHYLDFARKVVGVGSVGTEAFMVLLMGDRDDDPLFLQVKEADTRCSRPTRVPASMRIRANGSCRASGSRRPRATPSWDGSPTGAMSTASSTCASCAT